MVWSISHAKVFDLCEIWVYPKQKGGHTGPPLREYPT